MLISVSCRLGKKVLQVRGLSIDKSEIDELLQVRKVGLADGNVM